MAKKKTAQAAPPKSRGPQRVAAGENTPAAGEDVPLDGGTNPLAKIDSGLGAAGHRPSAELIYETIMRGGGEAFGAPFERGVQSLTEKIVHFFKQKSFFGFETFEEPRPKRRRNRFTRHGASRFYGTYDADAARRAVARKAREDAREKKSKKG